MFICLVFFTPYIYTHLYFYMHEIFYNRRFKIMLLIEKLEIIIMNADFKRQTDFCNQKEANRQGRQIKQNSIKVIRHRKMEWKNHSEVY